MRDYGNTHFKVHCNHLQSRIIVLPIIPYHPFISPSPSLLPPTLFFLISLSSLCPSIHHPATPPSNHFSWVGLIKGDLTECADHRNINQSLSNTASPRRLPQTAANVHSSAKVNCIHYIRDRANEGDREGEHCLKSPWRFWLWGEFSAGLSEVKLGAPTPPVSYLPANACFFSTQTVMWLLFCAIPFPRILFHHPLTSSHFHLRITHIYVIVLI